VIPVPDLATRARSALLIGGLLTLTACSGCGSKQEIPTGTDPPVTGNEAPFELVKLDAAFDDPVHLAAPSNDSRLFVVEQPGRIRIVRDGVLIETPFLDISDRVASGGERGLLSMAFHPAYDSNGYFFVNFTDLEGTTRVERFEVGSDPDRADPQSAAPVLSIEQPFANHNGGHLLFGPDGMLYVAVGDGGSGGDPQGNGQNRETLLGSILRLDVSGPGPYAIPADNPWSDHPSFRPEIWAWGLRNPWRLAFDPPAGLLFVADVGQQRREEINVVRADAGGLNFGWNEMEGSSCYDAELCDTDGLVLPAVEYDHSAGCSVTGGEVYRGSDIPAIAGQYFYSDYCRGWLRSFRYEDGAVDHREWDVGSLGSVASFGSDGSGELYLISRDGSVYAFRPRPT
jgi:glucose/arabinose dehydrogenase